MVTLTDEQNAFLDVEGKVVLCACPGSGKTFIVGKKLLKYLETWPYSYRGIAVLSFTNVASEEILRQTKDLADTKFQNIGFPHFIGTLDSFINTFIFLRFGYLIQPEERIRPRIIYDNLGQIQYPKRECHQNGCVNNPAWFHWSDDQLLKNGQPISCGVASQKPCVSFKKAMLKRGFATQREVPALSLLLLKKYPAIANEIAIRFPIIMVDEAQDTSREQMEIIELLADNGATTVVIVGDPDQAIYEWRNATPEYFKEKLTNTDWNALYLTANFRSSQNICNATSKFSVILSGKQPAEAKGEYLDYATKPVLLQVTSQRTKEEVIDCFLQLCENNGINPEDDSVAILTRGRIHSNTEIPDLWQTTETRLLALATYLWHCASRKEAYVQCEKALFYIMMGNANGLSSEDIRQIIESTMEYSVWKQKVISLLVSLPKANSALKDWKSLIAAKMEELIQQGVIKILDSRMITDIVKVKTRVKVSGVYSTEFLNRPLREYFEKRTTIGTTHSSVHGVKGETFDATLLMIESNTGNTITPSLLNKGQLDSELIRIAYVAMTRPRKLLVVSIPKQKSKNSYTRFPPEMWDYKEI
ncbi:MAG TPA: ATP-dependent helicase [Cyclobacteriaceae bacterium]|nr:ATP-dependent helicase [Cyclobacteriaceae bacterium]